MPGVNSRFLPSARAALMVAALSDGLARKKSASEMDYPAGLPPDQSVPLEFSRSAGTKTL
jgi:hypothetical protein